MGKITGKNNIGGIAGEGCDIFYSYAYNDLELSGEGQGSIAGTVSDEGTLYGNYYVEGDVGGIDGIGYEGGATPLSYEEFCSREEVPEAFSRFTVTFMADGKEVASYQCAYGDALSAEQIPAVPEKEGCYGVWPDFNFDFITGNKVLEAEYQDWTASIASKETSEDNRPLVMAEGEFYPGAKLYLSVNGESYQVSLTNSMEETKQEYTGQVILRVLCEDVDNAVVQVETDGNWQEVESTVIGSYRQFTMDVPGSLRVIQAEGSHMKMIILCAAGGAAVLLLIILLGKKAVKRRKKRKEAGQQEKVEEQKEAGEHT